LRFQLFEKKIKKNKKLESQKKLENFMPEI
jgi:hypothetical protein